MSYSSSSSSACSALLLALHWSSQHSYLCPPTDHTWSCVHHGCCHCFGQYPDCDFGIQGQETKKNHEMVLVAGGSNYVILVYFLICGVCLGIFPPFLEMDIHSEPKDLIIVCKGLVTALYYILGYLGSLACGASPWLFWPRTCLRPSRHQGQGHGGCGDLLHVGLHCWAPWLHLCTKVLHYSYKTWQELPGSSPGGSREFEGETASAIRIR